MQPGPWAARRNSAHLRAPCPLVPEVVVPVPTNFCPACSLKPAHGLTQGVNPALRDAGQCPLRPSLTHAPRSVLQICVNDT